MSIFNLIDQKLSLEQHYQELPLLRAIDARALPEEPKREDAAAPTRSSLSPHTIRSWEETVVGQVRTQQSYSLEQLFREFPKIVKQAENAPPRFIVLGPPGSGKSTLLEYLEYLVAKGDARIPAQVKIPICIELKRWEREAPNASLEEYLLKRYASFPNAPKKLEQWHSILQTGEALIAFDGIDEVSDWGKFLVYLNEALQATSRCPTILTGRTLSRARFQELSAELPIFYLGELNESQRDALIHAYFTQLGKPERAQQLIEQLNTLPQVSALALNPLMLGLLCYTVADERRIQLPATRSELYERALQKMLEQKRGVSVTYPHDIRLSSSDKLKIISYAVVSLFRKIPCTQSLLIDGEAMGSALYEAAKQAGYSHPREMATALKEDLVRDTRLLSGDESEGYSFLHPTFLEYLAARGLALQLQSNPDKQQALEFLQAHCDYPRWREVILFLAGYLAQKDRHQLLNEWLNWLRDESRDDMLRHRLALTMLSLAEIPTNRRDQYTELINAVSKACFAFWKELYQNRADNAAPHITDALRAIMLLRSNIEGQPFDEYVARMLQSSGASQVIFGLRTMRALEVHSAQPAILNALTARFPQLLSDGHTRGATVRAIKALGAQATPEILTTFTQHLPQLLSDEHLHWETVEAIGALGAQAQARIADALAQRLPQLLSDGHTRGATVRAIGALGAQAQGRIADALAQHLTQLLSDEDPDTRKATVWAIEALGAQAQARIADALAQHLPQLLQDPNPYTRKATVEAIGALGAQAQARIAEALAQHLPQLLQDPDPDPDTRWATVEAIKALGAQAQARIADALAQHLPQLLQDPDPDPDTRWATVEAIKALGAQAQARIADALAQHLPQLLRDALAQHLPQLLSDEDFLTRGATVLAIGVLGAQATPEILTTFTQHLPQLLSDEHLRWATVRAIGALGAQAQERIADALAQHLTQLLQDPAPDTRKATVRAIGALGAQATPEILHIFTQHLTQLLSDEDPDTRKATVWAIEALGAQATPEILTIFADHLHQLLKDRNTRLGTVWAIGALGAQATPEILHIFAQHLPQLLSDEHLHWETVEAIGALGAQAQARIADALTPHLNQLLKDRNMRLGTVWAIGALGAQATHEILNIFANHLNQLLQDPDTREATVQAIGALGAQATPEILTIFTQHLTQLLSDKRMHYVTVGAIGALGAQATPEILHIFAQHLPQLLSGGDPFTYWATVGAIEALGRNHPSLLNALCEAMPQLSGKGKWDTLRTLNSQFDIRFYQKSAGVEWKRVVEDCEEGA